MGNMTIKICNSAKKVINSIVQIKKWMWSKNYKLIFYIVNKKIENWIQ